MSKIEKPQGETPRNKMGTMEYHLFFTCRACVSYYNEGKDRQYSLDRNWKCTQCLNTGIRPTPLRDLNLDDFKA